MDRPAQVTGLQNENERRATMRNGSKKRWMLVLPLVCATLALLTTTVMAHGGFGTEQPMASQRQDTLQEERCECEDGSRKGGGFFQALGKLELSPAQKEELARLSLDFRERMIEARADMAIKELKLQRLWLEDEASQEEINQVIDQLAAIWAQTRKIGLDYTLKLQNILTDEQWETLQSSHHGRMGARPPRRR
jgi:Spy/CpxP family protein refolding chaperone